RGHAGSALVISYLDVTRSRDRRTTGSRAPNVRRHRHSAGEGYTPAHRMPVIRERRFLRVKLDMVGTCQLKCVMCHFAHPDFVPNKTQMGRELLEKIAADVFPRAHDVVLSSSAEPLLAKELPRALELCREYEVPNFHFSTNAMA